MTTYQLTVEGMGCSSCAGRVDLALKEAGFTVLSTDVGSAKIQSSMNVDTLKKTVSEILEDMGYMLTGLKAE
ncbi:MAG: heavy-metal-associated domain-containing protein [Clostridiaceae bacterium]